MSSRLEDVNWLDKVKWNADGLVTAIAQDFCTGQVLMLAWMSRDSLQCTVDTGLAHYWSRSRQKLWQKGESSGHIQKVKDIYLDCDGDAILMQVVQVGCIARHTFRPICFFHHLVQQRCFEH